MKIRPLTRASALAALALAGVLALAACGSSTDSLTSEELGNTPAASASSSAEATETAEAYPTTDVVSAVTEDPALHDAAVAALGGKDTIVVGRTESVGLNFLPQGGQDENGEQIGLQVDIFGQVAKKLGLTVDYEKTDFAAILTGVGTKFDVGQGNFAELSSRIQNYDMASYLIDGQSALGRADLDLDKITALTDLCGYKIITGAGSSFQTILANLDQTGSPKPQDQWACTAAGKPEWTATYVDDTAASLLDLASGKQDAYLGPTTSVAYLGKHFEGVKDLGQISSTFVGYAVAQGSPLGPVLVDAINALIASGDYAKIFEKWDAAGNAITESKLNGADQIGRFDSTGTVIPGT